MSLSPGAHLGAYEVVGLIGAGGMGEVYRARDPRLGREVAIKVLPSALAVDPDRLRRFEQEARAAAALNNAFILAVYDVGTNLTSGSPTPYIVSELLEGETLASRLTAGPLPVRKAVEYAVQIAKGLAAAHEKGIVHRDLKPANLFVTADGWTKILDFGLAKLVERDEAQAGASGMPTIAPDTMPGMVLGTLGYMSPEQVRGQTVDHRSDIFAFGAILYEMLSGQRAFAGASAADTISAILDKDPPTLSASDRHPSPGLVRIVDRCLEKNPIGRFQSTRDLAFALDALSEHSESPSAPSATSGRGVNRKWRLAWVAAAIVVVTTALAVGATRYFRTAPADVQAFRSTIVAPPDTSITFDVPGFSAAILALSPDGRRLAFIARSADNRVRLWVRPLDGISAQPLPGTEGASAPFWSPDSKFLGFFADGKLKKIDASGGPPLVLCDAPPAIQGAAGGGGSWNRDGVIVFGSTRARHLQRVSAASGEPSPVTKIDADKGEYSHLWPFFLPDGKHFIYLVVGSKERGMFDAAGVYVGSLDSNERKLVIPGGSNAQYAEGFLTFTRGSTLMAQSFDVTRLSPTSEAVPIVDQVFTGGVTAGAFSFSDTGVLAYETGGSRDVRMQLTWVDRNGKEVGTVGEQGDYHQVRLSPDGSRAAVTIPDPATMTGDIWIFDVARGLRTRFTFDPSDDFNPVWSPDGTRLAFSRTTGRTDIYQKASSGAGAEEVLLADRRLNSMVAGWSSDGRFISYNSGGGNTLPVAETGSTTGIDLGILPLAGDRKPITLVQTNFAEGDGQFSPDGRWVSYMSLESGAPQVYVTPFPGPGGKWQISTASGEWARWRGDGTELFYFSAADAKLKVASVNGQGTAFAVGAVRSLFDMQVVRRAGGRSVPYDVSADGQRFLVNKIVEEIPAGSSITLVVNWPALLKNQQP